MNNNKKYIKLEYNNYSYEIYVINKDKKIKLNKQNKIIMHKVLKKFPYKETVEGFLIYPNFKLITLYFSKEKLKYKHKKVNRKKSRKIIAGIALASILITGITIHQQSNRSKNNYYSIAIKNHQNIAHEMITFNEPDTNINEFNYAFNTPNDKEALNNASKYMEIFKKYERIYGIDANLLCAIGAQECSGIHYEYSITNGHSVGLMGIENIWNNANIRVFNFDTNTYEIITVDYSKIGELDYNIKIGAAIFQSYFYDTLRNNDSIVQAEQLAFSLQKYNMGPGNMNTLLKIDNNWIDNRNMINAGDSKYFEHVLSRLDNDTIINIKLEDGSYHQTKIINTALKNKHTRT